MSLCTQTSSEPRGSGDARQTSGLGRAGTEQGGPGPVCCRCRRGGRREEAAALLAQRAPGCVPSPWSRRGSRRRPGCSAGSRARSSGPAVPPRSQRAPGPAGAEVRAGGLQGLGTPWRGGPTAGTVPRVGRAGGCAALGSPGRAPPPVPQPCPTRSPLSREPRVLPALPAEVGGREAGGGGRQGRKEGPPRGSAPALPAAWAGPAVRSAAQGAPPTPALCRGLRLRPPERFP